MNNETKEFLYKRLKLALSGESKEAYNLIKKEKKADCRITNAMAKRILSNMSKETLIVYIIALRWHVTERDEIIEKANSKIIDLTCKNAEYKLKLNKIYSKREGE